MRAFSGFVHGLLDSLAPRRCPGCDLLLPEGEAGFCGGCGLLLDRLREGPAAYAYGGPLRSALLRLKYEGRLDHAETLGALLAAAAGPHAGRVDVVVPVPLHRRRLVERGFNQAALLAAPVARALEVPLALRRLERRRATAAQASLPRRAREDNVRGAFAAHPDPRRPRVLLVDDVSTTGATLRAAGAALLAAGASSVRLLALAGGGGDG